MSSRRGNRRVESDDVPEGWAEVALPATVDVNPRKPSIKELPDHREVSFVRMPALGVDGSIDLSEVRKAGDVRKGYTAFKDNDVIVAKITPCFENGKGAVARGLVNGHAFGTTELHVLRSTGAVLPQYIYHFIHQKGVRGELADQMTGTAGQERVPPAAVQSLRVPLPPLAEQRRIVAKIEELLAQVNAVRERLERLPAIIKRFRQAVLAASCSDGEEVELDSILQEVRYGTAVKCHRDAKWSPVLRIPNVAGGTINHDDMKYGQLSVKEKAALQLRPGDLLMIRSNGSVGLVGRTALVTEKEKGFAYAGYLMRLRFKAEVVPEYVNLALRTFDVRVQIEVPARSTSGVHNINSQEVKALRIRLPSPTEQSRAVRDAATMFALVKKVEERVALGVGAANLSRAVLVKAFRGELVPTEADLARRDGREYEPASALLERIMRERATVSSDGSRRPRARASLESNV